MKKITIHRDRLSEESLKHLQDVIGYHFHDQGLLKKAMMHTSYSNEHHLGKLENNERLEFLGDAVLELVSSDYLYKTFPDYPEGKLTRLRASLVCEPTLDLCAKVIPLGDYLLLGKGEDAGGGRERASIVSDAMEALIGAIYLDGGLAPAREYILKYILNDIEEKQLFYDSKTLLQEMIQGRHEGTVQYELLSETGPDHNKEFVSRALVGEIELGRGSGRTKKASEQAAAYQALLILRSQSAETRNS